MIKRMLIMLVAVGVVLGGIFAFKAFVNTKIKEAMAGMANPTQTVSTAKATATDWQSKLEAVGSLRAVSGADLSLELPGVVDLIDFKSGDDVKAGQLLLRLRVDDDVAKLDSLKAVAELAKITLERDQKQLSVKAISQAIVDNDTAAYKNDVAQVAQQQALLDKKSLKAPFAGHLGIRQVDLGQYLSAGTPIVTLQALDPIYVDFFLPQQALSQLKVGQVATVKVDAYPNQTFVGEITAINPRVEASSRNLQVRATLKNPDRKLLPGMYATVDIDSGAPQKLVTLPQTAITYNAYGSTVYIVDDKGKDDKGQPKLQARQTFVTTGATRGDQVAVMKGVKDGDTVITAGQMKLRDGSPVAVNNTIKPKDDANPVPIDQ
jgi:membrane fusion protein (multidrug efflux system)